MGYYQYYKDLLSPLRYYDLSSGAGAAELRILGDEMDALVEELDMEEREMTLMTAQDTGIEGFLEILPYVPMADTVEDMRKSLAALMNIDGRSFTEKAINATVRGCGVSALVTECDEPLSVQVKILGMRGIPDNFDEIVARIDMIMPCHLGITYIFACTLWRNIEEILSSWEALETAASSWFELENLV